MDHEVLDYLPTNDDRINFLIAHRECLLESVALPPKNMAFDFKWHGALGRIFLDGDALIFARD
jgi:hypothetical protein